MPLMDELKDITLQNLDDYFITLYLNVDPLFNKKADYMVHLKNMLKEVSEDLDKSIYKKVKDKLEKIENYVQTNKPLFKKSLVMIMSSDGSIEKIYNLNIPLRNSLVIDKIPFLKPLFSILSNYPKYAILLVGKDTARIFIVHLGEIVEYRKIHTEGVPGKHKKGGWFALSQDHYERHIDYHVTLHLKDVLERFDSFLSSENVEGIILGGSEEALSMVKDMIGKNIMDKVIGETGVEMFATKDEVLKKVEPIISSYIKKKREEEVEILINDALKNLNAVLGVDDVMNALEEKRVMRLYVIENLMVSGYYCRRCGFVTTQRLEVCPYCNSIPENKDNIIELAMEKAIEQDAMVEVVSTESRLREYGGVGALLRY